MSDASRKKYLEDVNKLSFADVLQKKTKSVTDNTGRPECVAIEKPRPWSSTAS